MSNILVGQKVTLVNGSHVRITAVTNPGPHAEVHLDNGRSVWVGLLVWFPIQSDGLFFRAWEAPEWAL